MKKLSFLFLLPILILASCNDDDDGYSLDKYWISLATVENPSNEPYFYLRLDNNELLWTAANNFNNYVPKSGQRVLADYTILNDMPSGSVYQHDIRLNDAYNILTKNIFNITPATQDSIGNDPVGITDMWVGGDYLNVKFFYPGFDKTHFVNLVRDLSVQPQENATIRLEFRHNAFNDAPTYRKSGMVCFNLQSLFVQPLTTPQRVNLIVSVKEMDGNIKAREFIYDPANKGVSPKEFTKDEFDEHKQERVQ